MLQVSLNSEKDILKKLSENYQDALAEVETRIAILQMRGDADLQHVIYQVEYQKQLKSQIETIIEQLHNNNFESVSEYLTKCYEQGFIGTLYDIQGQGIPLVFPIDQEMVAAAIQHETQLSSSLYVALGKDTKELSKKIASEISRGITNNAMYNEIASSIRQTTREIREMNKELNGKGEDPLAGIKALAVALTASRPSSSSDPSAKEGEPEGDMSTKEFDD